MFLGKFGHSSLQVLFAGPLNLCQVLWVLWWKAIFRSLEGCSLELNQGSDWDKYVAWTRETCFLQSESPLGSFHIFLQDNWSLGCYSYLLPWLHSHSKPKRPKSDFFFIFKKKPVWAPNLSNQIFSKLIWLTLLCDSNSKLFYGTSVWTAMHSLHNLKNLTSLQLCTGRRDT